MNRYTIHVTKACNMECGYCYQKDKSPENISAEVLMNEIDSILAVPGELQIEFLGGEPLLNIDGIEYCCKYINQHRDVRYMLTTNGTIYNPRVLSIIKEYGIQITISVDGTRFMHNSMRLFKNRKGSYDPVIQNAVRYNEELDNVVIQLTLHKYNVGYLYEGIMDLYNRGFHHINVGLVKEDAEPWLYQQYIEQHGKIIINLDKLPGLYLTPMMEGYQILDGNVVPIEDKYIEETVKLYKKGTSNG